MNEFTIIVLLLSAIVLITSEIPAVDVPDRSSAPEYRKPLFRPAKNPMSKRSKCDDVKFFETISESSSPTTTPKRAAPAKRKNHQNSSNSFDGNYDEIKLLLTKLLDKIGTMEKDPKRDTAEVPLPLQVYQRTTADNIDIPIAEVTEAFAEQPTSYSNNKKRKVKGRARKDKKQRWGKWTNWSPCSVSCGKGREIRWRHCLENCDVAETEMEEKTCQLPACGPSKLFGVIKL